VDTGLPDRATAEQMLEEAKRKTPGPWVRHSCNVALSAQNIAELCPQMDAEKAYVLGLLHDIGRREGSFGMNHVLDGYRYCMLKGFSQAAQICLTHSFPNKNIHEAQGQWEREEDRTIVGELLAGMQYDDYDRLIQLCDALGMASGFCLMEKRLMDVALRHGINQFTVDKWKAYFQVKEDFESVMKKSVYEVLPGIVENTFEFVRSEK